MQIRALSVAQPWANLVAEGRKTIETRRWGTPWRGWLLDCATKERRPYCPGPYGVALAVARLVDCRPMTAADEAAACCALYDGAWAWVLEGVQAFPAGQQFPVRGQLGLFTAAEIAADWEGGDEDQEEI